MPGTGVGGGWLGGPIGRSRRARQSAKIRKWLKRTQSSGL